MADFPSAHTVTAVAATDGSRGFRRLLRDSLPAHAIYFCLALAYLLAFVISGFLNPGVRFRSVLEVVAGILFFTLPIMLFALTGFKFAELAIYEKPKRPLLALWRNMKSLLSDPRRMAAGLPMLMALIVYMCAFTMVKANITAFIPFAWDAAFDRMDMAMHFGTRPWEWLQPLFGYWPVTLLINFNYNLWFIGLNIFWVYYAFIATPGFERTRYYIAFMLLWMVGGGLLAILFSSAGPCYYGRLGLSPDPYAGLMAHLRWVNETVPVWALATQDMLWEFRTAGSAFGGVSAMPSMHNATALLFVLTMWRRGGWLLWLVLGHGVLIFLGSVHLGWHYAVDAYLAWAIVLALWPAAGWLARWWEARPEVRRLNSAMGV